MYRLTYIAVLGLLCSCGFSATQHAIKYNQVHDYQKLKWQQDSAVLVLSGNGTAFTAPVKLAKGKFILSLSVYGKVAADKLPQLVIFIGDYMVRVLEVKQGLQQYALNFELPAAADTVLSMTLDDDYAGENAERDIFIYFPLSINNY